MNTGEVARSSATDQPLVLVVEDNAVNMRLMRMILAARGFRVQGVTTGPDALAWLARNRPAIVLLDMQLPGMDGFSLAAQIKRNPRSETIPVIAVTSYAMSGDEQRALAAGCDAYVSKPIDDRLLLETMRRLLSEASMGTPSGPSSDTSARSEQ